MDAATPEPVQARPAAPRRSPLGAFLSGVFVGLLAGALMTAGLVAWWFWPREPQIGRCGNAVAAAAALRTIASGQNTWYRMDCDGNGINDYAPACRLLHYQIEKRTGRPINIIDQSMADASSPSGVPRNGYRLLDMLGFDPRTGFGVCAYPAQHP
jgi:hypothetical protein